MRWTASLARPASCDRRPLDALLAGQLEDRAENALAEHLGGCETCQQRITELAAKPGWWLDASRWLEPASPGIDPCVDDLSGSSLDEFDSLYPSHETELLECGLFAKSDTPGMIGRLGRYEVKRLIGAGGTGIVLQAVDTELSRTVAIKVLAPTLAAHGAARKRFARESQAVAAVAHENVVAIHHVEGGVRVPYLVMQYVEGDSLQQRVIRDGPLDVTTTLRITAQLASALAAAHDQGLVHRDVKPANILVGPAGQRVWMTDFGLARAVDDASLTRTGFIAGTPHYMSPEQTRGATVRASSDLFGLGGVVYFMLTGRPPFRAERTLAILNRICTEPHRPVREVNHSVPHDVVNLLDRLLEKLPENRFDTADAVRVECLNLLARETSPDDMPYVAVDTEPSDIAPVRRRRPTIRAMVPLVALALFVSFVVASIVSTGQMAKPLAAIGQVFDRHPQDWTSVLTEADVAIGGEQSPAFTGQHRVDPSPANFETANFDAVEHEATSDNRAEHEAIDFANDGPFGHAAPAPGRLTRLPPPAAQYDPTSPASPIPLRSTPNHSNVGSVEPVESARFATDNAPTLEETFDESWRWQSELAELDQTMSRLEAELAAVDRQSVMETPPRDAFADTVDWLDAVVSQLNATSHTSSVPVTESKSPTPQGTSQVPATKY